MAGNSRSWTTDEMVGALLASAGVVALLVKWNLVHLQLNFSLPAPMVYAWPVALIGAGIALLWWQRRRAQAQAENGERK